MTGMVELPCRVWLLVLAAALLVASAQAACTGDPAPISDGFWDCTGVPEGGVCTAACRAGETELQLGHVSDRGAPPPNDADVP